MNACELRRAILTTLSVALTSYAMPAPASGEISPSPANGIPAIFLRLPKEELVSFAALPNDDTVAGQPGFMMYYGPPAAALVGVIAHGVIEGHSQAKERKNRNSVADFVLAPYQASLSHFTNAELLRRSLEGLTTGGDKVLIEPSQRAGSGWLIECSPKFFITQDARALVLQDAIIIHSPNGESPATFKNIVEVVGSPRDSVGSDAENTWMLEDGARLASESVDLMSESVNLALTDQHGDFAGHAAAYRTVRYPRGGAEKMERAQILRETRQRVVLKTLRGWIMSVPVAAPPAQPTAHVTD